MSTRSLIGRVKGDQIEGLYHHSDGYPHGIGCYLWRLREKVYGGDTEALLEDLFAHPAGWSHIFPSSSPVYKDGRFTEDYEWVGPLCYCHGGGILGPRNEPPDIRVAYPGSDSWDLEWAYGLSELGMTILKSAELYPDRDIFEKYGWVFVGFYPWDAGEPDWWAIEGVEHTEERYGQTWVDDYPLMRIQVAGESTLRQSRNLHS